MSVHATKSAAFADKYAPKVFADIVIDTPNNEAVLKQYIGGQTLQPLILYGPNGTGKSTIAKLLPYAMVDIDNSSDIDLFHPFKNTNTAELHQRIQTLASMVASNSNNLRFIIFDELDLFPSVFVKTVKACIDQYKGWTMFISTTNDIHALDKGHRSRSNVLHIGGAPLAQWKPRVQKIMAAENAAMPSDDKLENLLAVAKGDHRQFLSLLEQVANGTRYLPPASPKPRPLKVITNTDD
ncbi:MAG: AAA family ATPase [Alphaproteobacteria bacterium]|nr:AAA family ATPase [Alphaproteobacteria bacterium]